MDTDSVTQPKLGLTSSPKYFPALDGMRLFAILAVVLHHSLGGNHTAWVLRTLAFQDGNGLGVPLFFILSGLLLTSILMNTSHKVNRYRNFLFRRAVRTFPLYFAYLILAAIATLVFTGTSMQHLWVYALFLEGTFLRLAAETQSILPTYHFWTLAVQEQFYLIWPVLVWSCKSVRYLRLLCWGGIVLSFCVRILVVVHFGPDDLLHYLLIGRAGELCLGGLLAVEISHPTVVSRILPKCLLPLGAVYFIWAWKGLSYISPEGSVLGLQLVALTCAALVSVALNPASLLYRFFTWGPFGAIGKKYSYGIYVFHPMILMLFALPISNVGVMRHPLTLVCTGLVAWLSYNFYEKIFLQTPVIQKALVVAQLRCPGCNSTAVCRQNRMDFFTRNVSPLFGRFPWECFDCQVTFFAGRGSRRT